MNEQISRVVALLACLLVPAALHGQATVLPPTPTRPVDATTLADALRTAINSSVGMMPADELSPSTSIASLEKEFAEIKEPGGKAEIARVIVRLHDPNSEYYEFLEKLAIQTLDSDTPGPLQFDAEGKQLPQPAPAFLAWLLSRNITPSPYFSSDPPTAVIEQGYLLRPRSILLLGGTADPRAIPVLRRALLSHDYLIEQAGAAGLAEVHDQASIRYIIEAAERAPADEATALASALLYFDDPEAQRAVDRYVPKEYIAMFRAYHQKGDTALTIHTEHAPPE
jgi:hypothetical protein